MMPSGAVSKKRIIFFAMLVCFEKHTRSQAQSRFDMFQMPLSLDGENVYESLDGTGMSAPQ